MMLNFMPKKNKKNANILLDLVNTVKPVLRGHQWDKEKVAL
jgi:hypothetical protein